MDEERLDRLERKLDRVLEALDKFSPLLDKLMSGGGLFGKVMGRTNTAPTFGGKRSAP